MFPLKDNVPTRHFPLVTAALIVANVLVFFLLQMPDDDQLATEWAYHPCEVEDACPTGTIGADWLPTLFTSMFMHADLLHLGGNMLFLWIFGNNVEDSMGRVRFLVFYVLAGVAATVLQTIVTLQTGSDAVAAIPNLGASGAISGVLGAYLLILPRARVLTAVLLIFIYTLIEVPAILFLGVYFVFQAWQGGFQLLHPPEGGGVAVFAHIGGFVFGFLAIRAFMTRRPLAPRR